MGDKKSLLLPGVSLLSQGFDQTSICRAVFTEVGGLPWANLFFLEIITAEAVKEENFEDLPITGYPGFKTLNTALIWVLFQY